MSPWEDSRLLQRALASILAAISIVLLAPGLAQAAGAAHASIIGGDVAAIADFPSLAFIVAKDERGQSFACTGTVIAPRVILTAGHCVENLSVGGFTPAGGYTVVTGAANPREARAGAGDVLRVSSTHVFPGFDPGPSRGDAAILVLSSPTAAPAIPLAAGADGALYEGGAEVLLAGWGLTSAGAGSAPDKLHSTSNVVLNPASCKARTRSFYRPYSAAIQMCTTDPPDHANGGCFGDSGGPVIAHRADGSAVEIGVVSTGGPRCSTRLPNIFTRVDRVSTWATEWIAATEYGAPAPTVKLRLPTMSGESAESFVTGVLSTEIGLSFLRSRDLKGSCSRLGRARVKCDLSWRYGPKYYFGAVTVFYTLEHDTVAWDNSYLFHRVDSRCWFESGHRQSCSVQTRRG
jgi:secreted trypsin-like serine protease